MKKAGKTKNGSDEDEDYDEKHCVRTAIWFYLAAYEQEKEEEAKGRNKNHFP